MNRRSCDPVHPAPTLNGDQALGLNVREWFAGQALTGIIAAYAGPCVSLPFAKSTAEKAFAYADSMIAEPRKGATMPRHSEDLEARVGPAGGPGDRKVYIWCGDLLVGTAFHTHLAVPPEVQEANARLWAAAPELLAACRRCLAVTGGSANWKGETEEFLRLMEAAVVEATGELP